MGDDSNAIRLCMRENMRKLHLIRAEGFQTRLEINILERGMSIQTQTDILPITTTVIYSKRSSTLEMQCITFRENSQSCPIFCYWDSSITLKLLLKRACLATGNLLQCLFPSKHISGNTRGHVIACHVSLRNTGDVGIWLTKPTDSGMRIHARFLHELDRNWCPISK